MTVLSLKKCVFLAQGVEALQIRGGCCDGAPDAPPSRPMTAEEAEILAKAMAAKADKAAEDAESAAKKAEVAAKDAAASEDTYQGESNGHRVYTWGNGDVYKGQWDNGVKRGLGVLTYNNGGKYSGQWNNDSMHGLGVLKSVGGEEYRGQWKENKMDGFGVETSPNGGEYSGEYNMGKTHGKGVCTYAYGQRLETNRTMGKQLDDTRTLVKDYNLIDLAAQWTGGKVEEKYCGFKDIRKGGCWEDGACMAISVEFLLEEYVQKGSTLRDGPEGHGKELTTTEKYLKSLPTPENEKSIWQMVEVLNECLQNHAVGLVNAELQEAKREIVSEISIGKENECVTGIPGQMMNCPTDEGFYILCVMAGFEHHAMPLIIREKEVYLADSNPSLIIREKEVYLAHSIIPSRINAVQFENKEDWKKFWHGNRTKGDQRNLDGFISGIRKLNIS